MKKILIMTIGLLVATSALANEPYDSVMVRASQNDLSTISVGDKAFYVKSFNVMLLNVSSKPIDLSKVCFKAFDEDGNTFKVDTIAEELTQGTLKPQANIKGFIEFASEDDSVYDAQIVKLTTQCD